MSGYIFENDSILKYFIYYVIKKSLISTDTLFNLRKLCKKWKQQIEYESDDVIRTLKYQIIIREKLKYDKDSYDHNTYKRKIIKNTLTSLYTQYKKLKLPGIDFCYSDLDLDEEPEKIYFVSSKNMPNEFSIFLEEYYINPTVYVRLYPPEVIQNSINFHKNKLRSYLDTDLNLIKVIFLVPLCYSKHYKAFYHDKQYINILCYINIIDENLKKLFPEKYIVLSLELDDLENNEEHFNSIQKYLNNISKSIFSENIKDKIADYSYPENLASNSKSFERCFDILLQNQKFNL